MPDLRRIEILDGGLPFAVKRLDAEGFGEYSDIAGAGEFPV